jgi:lipopolysaccharide transport system permease protein
MLPVIAVGTTLVNFVLALPVLAAALLLTGHSFSPALAALPVVIFVQFLLTLSMVYALAALHVSFRDTQYLLGVGLLLGFYLSPVFYSVQSVPVEWQHWYALNPLVHILEAYRAVLIAGHTPDMPGLLCVAALAVAILVLSYRLFERSSHRFIEEIGN